MSTRSSVGSTEFFDNACARCTECTDDAELHHQNSFFHLLPDDDDGPDFRLKVREDLNHIVHWIRICCANGRAETKPRNPTRMPTLQTSCPMEPQHPSFVTTLGDGS